MSVPSIQVWRYGIEDPLLRRLVKHIWIMTSSGHVSVDNRMLPVTNGDLVFSHQSPTTFVTAGERPMTANASYFLGVHNRPHQIQQVGSLELFGVSFRPAGAFPFIGVPMNELRNRATDLDLIDKGATNRIQEELNSPASRGQKVTLLEKELRRILDPRRMPEKPLRWLVARLSDSRDFVSVEAVCEECGAHVRTAERWFHRYVGVGPKQFQRISRFQQASSDLLYTAPPSLTALAHSRGYFDQSHFIREFVTFAGTSPSNFLAADDSMRAAVLADREHPRQLIQ